MYDGTMLNPDQKMRREIEKRIRQRNGFCVNKEEKNEDTKCPCRAYRETGECDCGLYIKDYNKMISEMFDEFT